MRNTASILFQQWRIKQSPSGLFRTKMNERLLKLAEQAGYLSDYAYTDEQLTQFAQSVAAECASIAEAGLAPAVAQVIKEHFGIDKTND